MEMQPTVAENGKNCDYSFSSNIVFLFGMQFPRIEGLLKKKKRGRRKRKF